MLRSNSNNFQEVTQTTTTKNKITNNKKLITNTNRINADIKIEFSVDDLEDKILKLQQAKYEDRLKLSKQLFNIMRDISSKFNNFIPSEKDMELINSIADSPIDSHFLASKLISNAQDIIDKRKECRFGNLFVGIKELNDNFEIKYAV